MKTVKILVCQCQASSLSIELIIPQLPQLDQLKPVTPKCCSPKVENYNCLAKRLAWNMSPVVILIW